MTAGHLVEYLFASIHSETLTIVNVISRILSATWAYKILRRATGETRTDAFMQYTVLWENTQNTSAFVDAHSLKTLNLSTTGTTEAWNVAKWCHVPMSVCLLHSVFFFFFAKVWTQGLFFWSLTCCARLHYACDFHIFSLTVCLM